MRTEDKCEELIDLGAVSEQTLGYVGPSLEAFIVPDHQDKPN